MPLVKTQEEKTASTINAQPRSIEKSSTQMIMTYDLCGWKQGRIAEEVGMTQARVSVIMNSPLYLAERNKRRAEMQQQLTTTTVDKAIAGDPVQATFRKVAPQMAQAKVDLAMTAESEFVRSAAITECLAQAGYKPEQKKTTVSIMMTDKMASRFEKVLKRTVTTEVTTNAD
jgi:predicted XRE-type DNA-binding protein